jgi:Glucosamine 6-phosphate synthetase, contains amidotransferase and phosphosugar isomerase domains
VATRYNGIHKHQLFQMSDRRDYYINLHTQTISSTQGYAAGEMKHGPIALIGDGMPVVVIATPGQGL